MEGQGKVTRALKVRAQGRPGRSFQGTRYCFAAHIPTAFFQIILKPAPTARHSMPFPLPAIQTIRDGAVSPDRYSTGCPGTHIQTTHSAPVWVLRVSNCNTFRRRRSCIRTPPRSPRCLGYRNRPMHSTLELMCSLRVSSLIHGIAIGSEDQLHDSRHSAVWDMMAQMQDRSDHLRAESTMIP